MASLFIIGNGFDISHGLKTSYEDFHKYLKREYPDAKSIHYPPEYVLDSDGDDVPENKDEEIGFIEYLLSDVDGEKWSDLESSIGEINFGNYMSYYKNDEEHGNDLWHEMYFNEDEAKSLVKPILKIPFYFSEWISTIEIDKVLPKKDFLSLINKESDYFLSFNYTKTLEYLYGIENVCHIHGVQGEKLLFGHGNDYNYFSDGIYGMYPGTEESFQEMHDALKKDTKNALEENRHFFRKLSSVKKIYSYGFSFSKIDEIYIREICDSLDTRFITWYLNDFDDDKVRENYKNIIKKCGFKGSFNTYHINN